MGAADVYRKTAQGSAEITQRKMKLSPRLRTMLILVDGAQPELVLKDEGQKVGAPPGFIDDLVRLGLIEKAGRASPPSPLPGPGAPARRPDPGADGADEFTRFRAAKDFMNVTIVEAMGIKSFFFTLKLERAATRADLHGLAADYRAAIAKAQGDGEADVLAARLAEMLR